MVVGAGFHLSINQANNDDIMNNNISLYIHTDWCINTVIACVSATDSRWLRHLEQTGRRGSSPL